LKTTTHRLDLIFGTIQLLNAELDGPVTLQRDLEVEVPQNWPPDLYDRKALEWSANYLKENPDSLGWGQWYLILRNGEEGRKALAGIGGFKGKPSPDGTVEIGYSVLSQFQRKGLAGEAAGGLVKWAFSHPEVKRVIAETYPELIPSIRVMEKNGFRFIGDGSEPRVIRYEITRESFEK